MTITVHYNTKKDLKNNVGQELEYNETNIFKDEYTPNGVVIGCDINRKFFAKITIKNNIIERVQ
tara:strand:+ start:312 stop:503 length:192 start_codon:yes stop_codon:yes gene_type:complete